VVRGFGGMEVGESARGREGGRMGDDEEERVA